MQDPLSYLSVFFPQSVGSLYSLKHDRHVRASGLFYLLPHLHAFLDILQASAVSSFHISSFQITDAFISKKNLCLILFFAITTFQYAVYLFIHLFYYLFSPGEGNGNLLQYSCLENPMDREAWWAIAHGVTKSQTQQNMHAPLEGLKLCGGRGFCLFCSLLYSQYLEWEPGIPKVLDTNFQNTKYSAFHTGARAPETTRKHLLFRELGDDTWQQRKMHPWELECLSERGSD